MNQICDLHAHSVFSDGTYTPAQLLREAEKLELSALALTDHNTAAGLPDFLAAARNSPVEAVPGVEFSTDYNGVELHILALGLKSAYFDQVEELMGRYHALKEESNRALVQALRRGGFVIDYEAVKASTPTGQVNRAVIAAELLKKGYVSSVREAFKTLLGSNCGYYTPPERPAPGQMVDLIWDLGAVPVLAHPLLNLSPAALRQFLEEMRPHQLACMEVYYSTYSPEETATAMALADAFGLKYSGGSDFHGTNKPDIRLGFGKGNLKIPGQWWDSLRESMKISKM